MAGFGLTEKIDAAEKNCMSCGAPFPAGRESQEKFTGGNMQVYVFGNKDEKSRELYDNVNKALEKMGKTARVEMVEEAEIINNYHIRLLPALIINGSIVSQGIISSVEEIEEEIEFLS